jgi:hypothetical protein
MRKRNLFSLVAIIVAVLGLQGSASATIYLDLSDNSGGNSGLISNNGTSIVFSGAVRNFDIALTAGVSNVPGTASSGTLQITNLSVSLNPGVAAGNNVLTIDLAATNYSLPTGATLSLGSSASATFTNGTAGDQVSFQSFYDATNSGNFGAGVGTSGLTLVYPGGSPTSVARNDASVAVANAGNYALSNITAITITAAASQATSISTTGSTTLGAPAPSSLVVASIGALGLIGYGWRRRRALGA